MYSLLSPEISVAWTEISPRANSGYDVTYRDLIKSLFLCGHRPQSSLFSEYYLLCTQRFVIWLSFNSFIQCAQLNWRHWCVCVCVCERERERPSIKKTKFYGQKFKAYFVSIYVWYLSFQSVQQCMGAALHGSLPKTSATVAVCSHFKNKCTRNVGIWLIKQDITRPKCWNRSIEELSLYLHHYSLKFLFIDSSSDLLTVNF